MLQKVSKQIALYLDQWEALLLSLPDETIASSKNEQARNVKQILGHMVDSASNNTHRIIHLQYQESPISFPDYANHGNNDRWIAIQYYNNENWKDLVALWKYTHLHLAHIINNVDSVKFKNVWISALGEKVSLEEMIIDFPLHMNLHLNEIDALVKQSKM